MIGRYLLNAPIKGALGISEVLLVGIVFLAWPYTQAEDGNVKVEMFYEKFSVQTKRVVGIVRSLLAFGVFAVMDWQSVSKALESRESGEIIDVLNIPAYPFHFIVTLGVGVLCLQLLVDFMKTLPNRQRRVKVEPTTIGLICLCLFFLLIFFGIPIGFSFILLGFLGFGLVRNFTSASHLLASVPFTWASSYTMIVIPLFILMGQFAFESGLSEELYEAGYKWVGNQPGGIALGTTVACTLFAACTGSSLASAATMGTVALPELKRFHYSDRLATGCVAAGGTLGILIPPSVVFIIYGIITSTSIGKLFVAGILPGVLLSLFFLAFIYIRCTLNPVLGPRGPVFSWKERIRSLAGVWGFLVLFVVIIGGLYIGLFTPTEAGAAGAFAAFLIAFFRKRLNRKSVTSAVAGDRKDHRHDLHDPDRGADF